MVDGMEKLNFRNTPFLLFRSKQNNPVQLIINHGICEHSLRYLPFIKKLNNIGFDCVLIDHPGHGQNIVQESFSENFFHFYDSLDKDLEQSVRKIGELQHSSPAKNFQKKFLRKNKSLLFEDIVDFQKDFYSFLFREKIFNRSQKTIILGQSMGGLITVQMAQEINDLSGIILLSPAFKALTKPKNENSRLDRWRYKLENRILTKSDESFTQSSLFSKFILKPVLSINPANDCSWASHYVSDIGEINEIFSIDPFIGRKVSLKFLQSIQHQMKIQREIKCNFPCPVFIEYGEQDKIVSAAGSAEFISNRLNNSENFVKPIQNFEPHEIHNSKRRSYLVNDILEWSQELS